jgi:hydrogenase maturation protease
MARQRILVAGIGNIFLGDDGFGVAVAQRLAQRPLPTEVQVVDFGIRSFDLAYALLDDPDAAILVDATPRGGAPGTLYLIEPDLEASESSGAPLPDAHSLNPVAVLQLVSQLGRRPRRLLVVGCEPAALESEDGRIGLSEPVQAAVDAAVRLIESVVADLLHDERAARDRERENPPDVDAARHR